MLRVHSDELGLALAAVRKQNFGLRHFTVINRGFSDVTGVALVEALKPASAIS